MLEASDFTPGVPERDHLRVLLAPRACRAAAWTRCWRWSTWRTRPRAVGGYSLGMRQRLGLAAALLGDPELLMLDEPANGLDPEGVRWLRDFLRAFAADGRTVFVSSHHLAEVAQTVDQVVIINRGRLVVESPFDRADRTRSPARCASSARPAGRARAGAARRRGAAAEREDGALRVRGAYGRADRRDRAGRGRRPDDELVTESSSLEDVFLDLTAEPR